MGLRRAMTLAVCLCAAAALAGWGGGASAEKRISLDEIKDRIMGGWVGQGVGVTFGAPYEFRSNGVILETELQPWSPERLEGSLGQDDLYVDMTFIAALEAYGPDITYEQVGHAFGATLYPLWHANAAGRENIRKGILPPLSGHPRYNIHADDIDFQIECDGIGMVCPGLPLMSNELGDVFGHIMNYGDGVYGGLWIAAMYTQAFFERDPAKLVKLGLQAVPPESTFAKCISDVIAWRQKYPDDWRKCWREVEQKWQDDVDCAPGKPFNIDAKLNSAYVAIALLYGAGDWDRTMEIGVRCGQDNDCNPASACGVLGCAVGLAGIEERFKSHLPALRGRNFSHTNYSYDTITDACARVALKVIEKAGGRVEEVNGVQYAVIPDQAPAPPDTLEQWTTEAQKARFGKK